jgi:probable F420-dependent oxidoreductase
MPRMEYGIVVFQGSETAPDRLARAVEDRGFESLFYPEHTHIPVSSRRSDGVAPRSYADTVDPFVALAMAAAVTTSLRLGTAVCLVPQRDVFATAKAAATLDRFSGGRFLFGVGAGWNRPELVDHGVDPRHRMAVLAERVAAIKALWTAEEASFHGSHVDFDPAWSWPKPAQRPHPPVLVGGNGPTTEDRVLAYGDGWLPQCGHLASTTELRDRIDALRARAADAGRGRIPVTLFGVPPKPDLLAEFAAAGVDRCLLLIRDDTAGTALSTLDSYAAVVGAAG